MRLILELIGGLLQGTYEFPDAAPRTFPTALKDSKLLAWGLYWETKGEVGRQARCLDPVGFRSLVEGKFPAREVQTYQVTDRREGEALVVTMHNRSDDTER